jgi:ABC-type multidrug transport system ATPase subunit
MIHFDPVLVVTELTKVYRGKPPVTAVDRLSFSLGRGEILGLLGPNGAGKTTTIQMLLSALEPTSGRIAYFGESLKSARALILGQVGFASAYSRLPARLTVAENLDVFGRLYGLPAGQRKARIQELLSKFGVWDLRKRTTERLSSGQVTRVMLAKAFLARPRVVLLDEPTASLDPDIAVLVSIAAALPRVAAPTSWRRRSPRPASGSASRMASTRSRAMPGHAASPAGLTTRPSTSRSMSKISPISSPVL